MKNIVRVAMVNIVLLFFSCKKTEVPAYLNASDYYPLHNGMVWVYKLDSTATNAFGTALVTNSYHLKDSAGTSFNDNTGHESWPVYRFITDTAELNPWQSISTYYVTPVDNKIEVVDDNNLRFIKLISPVTNGKSWLGNSYIDTRSLSSLYPYLDGWNYMYDSVNLSYNTLAGVVDSTVIVLQRDETSPDTPFDPQYYQQRNYAVEVYAYNKGLIYKNFLHWTWQPTPAPARYEDGSYGIVLNLLRIKQ
jgi:hypothetical protein